MKLRTKKKQTDNEEQYTNQEYLDYVSQTAPKSKEWITLIPAFIIGGIICMLGQLINDLLKMWTELDKQQLGVATSIILIFLGSFLTAIGIYDRLGRIAGGGSIVPITGFANSVVSPAMEYNREGVILGICTQMFAVAGPIIVIGIAVSVLIGLLGMIFV